MVWHASLDALMRMRPIEVPHVLLEDTPQVLFAQEQNMIEAFTTNAAQQPVANGVRPGCPHRRSEHLDPAPKRHSLEVMTILRIVVANEILRPCAEGRCLTQRVPGVAEQPVVGW